ncbi:uncharacterized protein LOC130677738 [Microplitis mediator]|uniref:uncharacterized protein LOC130677738 n=1 Tax=Microplitis mediator TaxID=375433 RepID=UPI0025537ACC|nr:uncharacterized protein LOC130677738 [Microplitis mediator]
MSRENSFRKLVSGLSLDGCKPSELYAEMCKHADNALDPAFIRTLWMDRMPKDMQMVLSLAEKVDSTLLLEIADKTMSMCENQRPPNAHIAAVSKNNSHSDCDEKFLTLTYEIRNLATKLDNFMNYQRKSRSPSPHPHNNQSRTPSADRSAKICFYHKKYGVLALHCVPNCSWKADQENATSHQ